MFGPVERLVAGRYLRPRRQEGFVSVIAAFSFLGIMLGVATLIVVLAVMSGFRAELLGRVLGFNGHITVQAPPEGLADFDSLAARLREAKGVFGSRRWWPPRSWLRPTVSPRAPSFAGSGRKISHSGRRSPTISSPARSPT